MQDERVIREEAERLFHAKQRRRRELASLPFEEKIRILIDLQKMASDIRATVGGARRRPWGIRRRTRA